MKRNKWTWLVAVALAIFAPVRINAGESSKAVSPPKVVAAKEEPPPPRRIVSCAPSITETLFAIGAGKSVVGVTKFCDYPPTALSRAKIGGYITPNYEAILRLKPDLVVLLKEQVKAAQRLKRLGLRYTLVSHHSVTSIRQSFEQLGKICGRVKEARALAKRLAKDTARVQTAVKGKAVPRVMIVVHREVATGRIGITWITGQDGPFDEMVTLAGGNLISKTTRTIGAEGALGLNPDVIIDLVSTLKKRGLKAEQVKADWRSLPGLRAVKNKRLYVLSNGYVARPGPRYALTVRDLARAIHPEIDWERVWAKP